MKTVVPSYYPSFHCIAGRCHHTCCAGWEIDIDAETRQLYEALPHAFGEKIRENIVKQPTAQFQLQGEQERCPFLNQENLCEIILHLGEDALCQVCRDHPRYRNFFSNRIEIGLGLCCEEAARLILSQKEAMCLQSLETTQTEKPTEEEKCFFAARKLAFSMAQNREKTIAQRIETLLGTFSVNLPNMDAVALAQFLLSLERLDEAWTEKLNALFVTKPCATAAFETFALPFEQLLCYFLYRLHDMQTDKVAWIGFAAFSVQIIALLCDVKKQQDGSCSFADLTEICRLYSSEIEYSEENVDAILDYLWSCNL